VGRGDEARRRQHQASSRHAHVINALAYQFSCRHGVRHGCRSTARRACVSRIFDRSTETKDRQIGDPHGEEAAHSASQTRVNALMAEREGGRLEPWPEATTVRVPSFEARFARASG
jgi:hypothetical protein